MKITIELFKLLFWLTVLVWNFLRFYKAESIEMTILYGIAAICFVAFAAETVADIIDLIVLGQRNEK